jgi:hypothetical protein
MIKKACTTLFLAGMLNFLIYAAVDSVVVDTINNYNGWGWEVLVVHNNYITLGVIPSIGARVLQYDLGVDTFMIVNPLLFGDYFYGTLNNSPTPYSTTWGYGGYKTWPAPQSNWNWPPPPTLAWGNYDYEVFQYNRDSSMIWMKGQTEVLRTPGLRFDRYITVYRNSTEVKVTTVLFNDNPAPEEWGIWDVTQSIVRHNSQSDYQNFSVYFPITSQDDIWYNPSFQDTVPDRREILPGIEQVKFYPTEGKIFASVPEGWLCYVDEKDKQTYAKVFDIVEGAQYPDGGGIVQLYTNGSNKYMEIEVTGPLATIGANGDSIVFTEYWYAGKSDGPIHFANHAGVVREPLNYSRSSLLAEGKYAAFNEGTFTVAYFNDANESVGYGPSINVAPDTSVDIELELSLPSTTRYIDIQSYNSDGNYVGTIDRFDAYADDSFVAYKDTTGEYTIDGIADEPFWQDAQWYPLEYVWLPWNDVIAPDDFTGKFKVSWTNDRLLFLVEVVDDSLYDGHVNPLQNYWDDDCVELFLDEDHSGGNHLNNYNAFAYHVSTLFDVVDNGLTSAMLFNDHIQAMWTKQDHTYTWELAVKVFDDSYVENGSNTPDTLVADKEMGFSMAYCDNDGSPSRENFIGSKFLPEAISNNSYIDASIFGTLTLLGPDEPILPVTVSENINQGAVDIYPNPASGEFNFKFTGTKSGSYQITVKNLTGQIVSSAKVPEGVMSGSINIESLEPGLYTVSFISHTIQFTKPIIKL